MTIGRRLLMRAALGAAAAAGVAAVALQRASTQRSDAAEAAFPPIGERVAVEIGGGTMRLHLIDRGPRSPHAVVLIHGASGNLRDFAFNLAQRLAARGRRVIAIDRPGFGYSDRAPAGAEGWRAHRPDAQAAAMRAATAALGVTSVTLVGHSLGAASALAWALDAPETCAGVLALSGVSHAWPGAAGYEYDLLSAPVIGGAAAALAPLVLSDRTIDQAIAAIFAPQAAPDGYAGMIGARLSVRPATLRANAADIARLKPLLREQSARYPSLGMPVEAMHGDADVIVPLAVHAEPLAAAAPRGRLTRLAGVGHMPHHAAPDAVLAAIDRLSPPVA